MALESKDNIKIKGSYRFVKYEYNPASLEEVPLSERKKIWEGPLIENLIVINGNHGLNIVCQHIIGDDTYPLEITQAKIGSGTTAAASTDTDLETIELAGIIRANQSYTGGVATLQFFMPSDDLANDTYTEFGIFCGSQLFARSIISPSFTKSTNEDTGVDYTLTFTNT
jgi:hypothetical protein